MNLEIDPPMDDQAYTNEFEHLTVGERLRRAREAKGTSLEEIATHMLHEAHLVRRVY